MAKHTVEFEVKVSGQGEKGFKKIEKASEKAQKSSTKYQKSIVLLRKELTRLTTQRDLATDPKRIKALNREIAKTKKQIDASMGSTNKLGGAFKKLGAVVATAAIGKKILDIGTASVKASAQMEKFSVTLKTMLGSNKAAGDRMAEYLDIAKITPFSLTQVVEAGNQLQAMGRYSRQNLVMLGDLAAAAGKPLEQVMGAYAKLSTGQKGMAVDMFRDLLISSQDWVDATGKGITKGGSMIASAEEMMAALPKIMEKKGFTGLMAAQSRTTEGMVSNLGDAVYSLNNALGERLQPSVKGVVGWLGKMVGTMEDAVKIPIEQKIASEKVELNMLVNQLIDANDEEEMRKYWLSELQLKYPEFLRNIDLEKEGTEGLKKALVDVNAEYDKRIKKAIYAKQLEDLQGEYEEEMGNMVKYQMAQEADAKVKELIDEIKSMGIHYGLFSGAKGQYYYDEAGNKVTSGDKLAKARGLYGQIKAYNDARVWFNAKGKEQESIANMQMIAGQMQMMENMMKGETVTEGDSSGNTSKLGIERGHAVSRINVGKIEIHANTLTESVAEMERIIAESLTNAADR